MGGQYFGAANRPLISGQEAVAISSALFMCVIFYFSFVLRPFSWVLESLDHGDFFPFPVRAVVSWCVSDFAAYLL